MGLKKHCQEYLMRQMSTQARQRYGRGNAAADCTAAGGCVLLPVWLADISDCLKAQKDFDQCT